jgi:putative ABC transport system ATP-binding protein
LAGEAPNLQGIALTRSFGSGETLTPVLRGVALDLYPGRFYLVIGPSGCGKSTLLAVLSGLLRPDCGRVLVLGRDLWAMPERQRRQVRLEHFGFIFQGYNLFPVLTAREQLEMVARWGEGLTRGAARCRVAETLDALGLARKADLLPAQLSGGEKQRVAIGRALLKRPAFCFADEPTSALDWAHGRHVVELLHGATRRQNATVLTVAHDPRIAEYADVVFRLDDGLLSEQRAPASPRPEVTPR